MDKSEVQHIKYVIDDSRSTPCTYIDPVTTRMMKYNKVQKALLRRHVCGVWSQLSHCLVLPTALYMDHGCATGSKKKKKTDPVAVPGTKRISSQSDINVLRESELKDEEINQRRPRPRERFFYFPSRVA
jgi:hypothetical protein